MRVARSPRPEECAYDALRSYRAARDGAGIRARISLLGNTSWQRGDYERAERVLPGGAEARSRGAIRNAGSR